MFLCYKTQGRKVSQNSKMKKLSILFLILLSFSHCEKLTEIAFPDDSDIEVGLNFDKEIRSSSGYRISQNEGLRNYVQSITDRLLKSPAVQKKSIFKYQVTILEDAETINAFCTPGGFIYVYTGLLQFIENEATLAAILAHEIAHAEKRHARQRMLGGWGVQLFTVIISIFLDSSLAQFGMELAGNFMILQNSRDDELEADELAFEYLEATPYYRGAISYFFEKIQNKEKSGPLAKRLESLFSTHPIPEERLQKNEERILKAKIDPPSEENLFTTSFQRMAQRNFREEPEPIYDPELDYEE